MSPSFQLSAHRIITGQDRSLTATAARAGLLIAEPFYAAAMRVRNACYDRGIFQTHDLHRPTISVGNITTGGTGKTPVVKWLADELRRRGHHPAILLRGYGSTSNQSSDEAQLLELGLNDATHQKIPVQPNPSRVQAAADVLADHPDTTHFILDDGFQHRKAKRDFNLVLISATQPFGFGHVLPRGLLREPLSGLARANAFLITRCSLVAPDALLQIDRYLATHHPSIPVFHCDHQQSSIWLPASGETKPMQSLANQKVFLTAGIGDPAAFEQQIASLGCTIIGTRWLADHHLFTASDMQSISASAAGAALVLTTEKDWVKIKSALGPQHTTPIAVVKLDVSFMQDDAELLIDRMLFARQRD